MTTGQKIYELRKTARITQEEFADRLNVSRQAVSKWEADAAYPETDKIIKIAELFGVSCDYLLKENQTVNDGAVGKRNRAFLSMMISFAAACLILGYVIAIVCYYAMDERYSSLIGLGVLAGLALAAFILWSVGRYLFLCKSDYLEIDKYHLARWTKAFFFTAVIALFIYIPAAVFCGLKGTYTVWENYLPVTITYFRKLTVGEYALSVLVYGAAGCCVAAFLSVLHNKALGKNVSAVKITDTACVAACVVAGAAAYSVALYNVGDYSDGYYNKLFVILFAFALVSAACVIARSIVHRIYEKTPAALIVLHIVCALLFVHILLDSCILSAGVHSNELYIYSLGLGGLLTAGSVAMVVLASIAAAKRKDFKGLHLISLSVLTYLIFGTLIITEIFLAMEFVDIMACIAVYAPIAALLHAPFVKAAPPSTEK